MKQRVTSCSIVWVFHMLKGFAFLCGIELVFELLDIIYIGMQQEQII